MDSVSIKAIDKSALNGNNLSIFDMDPKLLDAKALAAEIPLPNVRTVHELRRARKIPAIVVSRKVILFDPVKVRAALAKYEVRAI